MPFDADGNPTYTPLSYSYDIVSDRYNAWQDREGNIWESPPAQDELGWTSPKLILSAEVSKDPYISATGIAQQDPSTAQALYDLKQSNPTEFYNQIAPKLTDKIYQDWRMNNSNAGTQEARNLLEGIKSENPQAYYTSKLTDLGRNVGWQIGQNRNDRNAPTIEQIKALVPDAMKAGLSASQIDSIVGNNINAANAFNQQRIANEAASGNFWTENILGALKVGALGLGAAGLDSALGAGAAAAEAGSAAGGVAGGTSTGTGLTGGAGGSTGLLGGGTVGTISAPTSAGALGLNAAAESAIAAGAGAGLSTGASSFAPAGVGGLNAALPAAGSVGGAGSMSAALPAGTIIGDGTLGTIMGASYAASAPGQFAIDALGNAIPASSVGIGSLGGVSGGYDLLSNLGNALKGAQVAKGLLGAGKNPAVNQPMGAQPMQQQQKQYAGVDYSPILNLLAVKSPERTRTSLLG